MTTAHGADACPVSLADTISSGRDLHFIVLHILALLGMYFMISRIFMFMHMVCCSRLKEKEQWERDDETDKEIDNLQIKSQLKDREIYDLKDKNDALMDMIAQAGSISTPQAPGTAGSSSSPGQATSSAQAAIYITRTGIRYHHLENCRGLEAARGQTRLSACKICAGGT